MFFLLIYCSQCNHHLSFVSFYFFLWCFKRKKPKTNKRFIIVVLCVCSACLYRRQKTKTKKNFICLAVFLITLYMYIQDYPRRDLSFFCLLNLLYPSKKKKPPRIVITNYIHTYMHIISFQV
jgi:hypothetical protein